MRSIGKSTRQRELIPGLSGGQLPAAIAFVGRTPSCARVPLDPLLESRGSLLWQPRGRRGRRLRTQGSAPPTSIGGKIRPFAKMTLGVRRSGLAAAFWVQLPTRDLGTTARSHFTITPFFVDNSVGRPARDRTTGARRYFFYTVRLRRLSAICRCFPAAPSGANQGLTESRKLIQAVAFCSSPMRFPSKEALRLLSTCKKSFQESKKGTNGLTRTDRRRNMARAGTTMPSRGTGLLGTARRVRLDLTCGVRWFFGLRLL